MTRLKLKPFVTCSSAFSRALRPICSSADFSIALYVYVVFGPSNRVGFGFATLLIPNRTILVHFGGISGEFGRAIPMARPDEPDMSPKCTQISLNFRCPTRLS